MHLKDIEIKSIIYHLHTIYLVENDFQLHQTFIITTIKLNTSILVQVSICYKFIIFVKVAKDQLTLHVTNIKAQS